MSKHSSAKSTGTQAPRSTGAALPTRAQPRWLEVLAARPKTALTLLTIAMLLPFIGRPLEVDDPMYVWAAEQIRAHPLDFYGFSVFWAGADRPMPIHMQNPPLACYYIAGVSFVAGFGVVALHLAFLLPAVGVSIGTYQLAREMCRLPSVLAGLVAIITPVFVLCANTITNDMLMTCFWVWAVAFWDRGLRTSRWPLLLTSSLLIAAACLTKYPGVNLIPLLGAYTIARRASWFNLFWLLVPVGALMGYELLTRSMYRDVTLSHSGLISEAIAYARQVRERRDAQPLLKTFIALGFLGACIAPALLLSPILWTWRNLGIGTVIIVLILIGLASVDIPRIVQLRMYGGLNWPLALQMSVWVTVGVSIMWLAVIDLWRSRSAESLLLALWIGGTFAFAGIVNWSVNGRTLLPLVPAVSIILVRRLGDVGTFDRARPTRFLPAAILGSAALCLVLGWADTRWAMTSRAASEQIVSQFKPAWGTLWFQGHWGFQHLMQDGGAEPFVVGDKPIRVNDIVAVPMFNSNTMPLGEDIAEPIDDLAFDVVPFVSTMNVVMGAGFYSDSAGPLPFTFGPSPQEQYRIYRITKDYIPARQSQPPR